MKVSRKAALSLFGALGFKTAKRWDAKKMESKIAQLPELVAGAKLTGNMKIGVKKILAELKKGNKVEVIAKEDTKIDKQAKKEVEAAAKRAKIKKEEKRNKDKKDKKKEAKITSGGKKKETKKTSKKEKRKTAPKKEKKNVDKNVDKFGSRKGSNTAKINKVLSKKSKGMATLVEEAGLKGTFYNHLNKLVEKGVVTKSDKGYKLA